MNDLLRKLAEVDSATLPFLSIYLDVRPEATGQNPQTRAGLTVLKDRLHEIRKTFLPRGDDLDSFEADAARIEAFVEGDMERSTEGLAIFACNGLGVWEVVEAATQFENRVSVSSRPDLYQLAKLDDEFETSVVGVFNTNTARLFVYRHGRLTETDGPDDDPVHYRLRATGGWSQSRYQRHIGKHRKDFGEEAARALGDLVEREGASRVLLAGEESAMEALRQAMPPQLAEKVTATFRSDMRASADDIESEAAPLLLEAEREDGQSLVERLIGEVRRGGLGVAGVTATAQALEQGQVDTVVIDESRAGAVEREELVRLAVMSSADVEVVQDVEALAQFDGVGGLLRYRY